MNFRKSLTLIATGLALTALGAGTSVASAAADAPSITLQYSAMDLATLDGAQRLEHRIRAAAARVCPSSDSLDLERSAQERACQARVVARAVRQIGNPQLTALFAAQHASGLKG